MKENTKRILTDRKTVLGFELADLIGIMLLLIPFTISILTIKYNEEITKTFLGIKTGTETIEKSITMRPTTNSSLIAVAFYTSLIVRYSIFKKESIAEIIVSVLRTFLLCWTIAALIQPILGDEKDPVSIYLLIAAVALSWLGMKTIAGYSWFFFIAAAAKNYQEFNNHAGWLGAVFIITLAVSLYLQIKDLSKISDFITDFKVSTTPYSNSIKESMHAAAHDASKRAAYAGEVVKQTAQAATGSLLGRQQGNADGKQKVDVNYEALDVNKDGLVDEKDLKILVAKYSNHSDE